MGISVIGSSSDSNNFSVDIGTSGNEIVILNKEYVAGAYSITSQLADSTLDIYAINADGTVAGYTNTKALSCSKGFSKLVIYGATTNDLLTFEYKTTFTPSESGNISSGVGPFIDSISPSDLPNIDDTTVITGGNFANNVAVTFTGTNNTPLNAKSIVRSSSTSLLVTRPDALIQDYSPYDVTVSNPGTTNPESSNRNKLTDAATAGGDPVWSTSAGALTGATGGSAYSVTLLATDPEGGSVTYSVVTGQLPTGLSLNQSTGVISGTPTGGSQTFTIAATDSGGNVTNRSFSINVTSSVTGGTVTEHSGYRVHTFTTTGTLTVAGDRSNIQYLLVGGGGGGGSSESNTSAGDGGGGGGAGGMLVGSISTLASGEYNVVVGAGGAGMTSGGDTSFNNIVAFGGGRGGSDAGANNTPADNIGIAGGSGGGAASVCDNTTVLGGAGTEGQGNAGGNAFGCSDRHGAGGGGAGGAGSGGNELGNGAGGPGVNNNYRTGSNSTYAGGGGGGAGGGASNAGTGGSTIGGNGGALGNNGSNGAVNTGSGGGGVGAGSGASGGNGSSGIVVIRYPI